MKVLISGFRFYGKKIYPKKKKKKKKSRSSRLRKDERGPKQFRTFILGHKSFERPKTNNLSP